MLRRHSTELPGTTCLPPSDIWGFQDTFLSRIELFYSNPRASVRVNGHLSDAFTVRNGTRQGCPLSSLYVLSLEPFLRSLAANKDIKEIPMNGIPCKIAAFTDDIILFLTDLLVIIPNLLKALADFHSLSNVKINFDKSNALNISLP